MVTDQQLLQRDHEIEVHAWLLIWSWAFLLPSGALIWTHTKKHRDLDRVPFVHVLFGGMGVVLALVGFAYGVRRFDTFAGDGASSFRAAHAVMGTIATAGMIGQVLLLSLVRRANVGEVNPFSPRWQRAGHLAHRRLGYVWIACGLVACETGTHVASVTDPKFAHLGLDAENERYAGGFIVALVMTAVVSTGMTVLYERTAGAEARAFAPAPDNGTGEREEEIVGGGGGDAEVPAPPKEVFEIGDLEMEDVNLGQ